MSRRGARLLHDDVFRVEIQRDLEFIQFVLALVQQALPLKNIDIQWQYDLYPGKSLFPNRLGTRDAQPQFEILPVRRNGQSDPSPSFCNLVHDCGRKEHLSCARSDIPAESRARRSAKPQVYTCHAGLIDICVPIFAGDRYLGCIRCGQVLVAPPTSQGFNDVKRNLAGLDYIDLRQLRREYFKVPVVAQWELDGTVQMLVTMAEYLARSWERLESLLETRRKLQRDLPLRGREFAGLVLSGQALMESDVLDESRQLGFSRPPKVVMVVDLGVPIPTWIPGPVGAASAEETALRALQAAVADTSNLLVSPCERGQLVILLAPPRARNRAHEQLLLSDLARRMRDALAQRSFPNARVGIGTRKRLTFELRRSYEEALAALSFGPRSANGVQSFEELARQRQAARTAQSYASVARLAVEALEKGSYDELGRLAAEYFACLRRDSAESPARACHAAALLLELLSSSTAGSELRAAMPARNSNWFEQLSAAGGAGQMLREAEQALAGFLASLRSLEAAQDAATKRVLRVAHYIQSNASHQIRLGDLAQIAGCSAPYLSRTFKDICGVGVHEYIELTRVAAARELLANTELSVTECAFEAGFSDRAHFSRVFKRVAGVSPRRFRDSRPPGALVPKSPGPSPGMTRTGT